MTVKRTQVQLFVEAAPVDAFDPDGDQLYQVVAVDRAEGTVWHLTDRHRSRGRAMDQLRRSVQLSATRHELTMIGRQVGDAVALLERRVDRLWGWVGWATGALETVAESVNRTAQRVKGGGGVGVFLATSPWVDPATEDHPEAVVAATAGLSVREIEPMPDRRPAA